MIARWIVVGWLSLAVSMPAVAAAASAGIAPLPPLPTLPPLPVGPIPAPGVAVPVRPGALAPSFDLDGVSVAAVMKVVYVQAFPERAYFLDPAVLQDQRAVSFRYTQRDGDFMPFLAQFLRNLGYQMEVRGGADFIGPLPKTETLSVAEDPSQSIFVYRPRYRDGNYLAEMLAPLFKGKFTNQHVVAAPGGLGSASLSLASSASSSLSSGSSSPTVAPSGSALEQVERVSDQLVFYGSLKEVAVLKKLLGEIDTDSGQVVVSGVLYEVQTGDRRGSALALAGSLLSGRIKFNLGLAQAADNFLSVQVADLQAVVQSLDSDSRFKVLANPSVRVASGRTATFVAGDEVPVLGAITYPQGGGPPIQSVDYRSSGVIFNISPQLHDASIDLSVNQEVSSFANTSTGVNSSPTLTKRQIRTDVVVKDGEVVVIGGLKQSRDTGSSTGASFLPWFKASTSERSDSEILLFLQVRRL